MKNDFTGFSFDGIHSSILGILRVSEGDRYEESLQSDFEDKQTFVGGRDGEYYFGSNYKARNIKISIAFDSVTEKQFRLITNIFSTKKVCPLIFDERPYKMYMAKLAAPMELSYVCFDQQKRIAPDVPTDGIRIVNRETVPGETNVSISTTSESLTNLTIDSELFLETYSEDGTYTFVYDLENDSIWAYNGDSVRIWDLGIEFEGDPTDQDTITVTVATEIVDTFEREQIYPWIYLDETERIYKGEGTIEFVCVNPFAQAPFHTLEKYSRDGYYNKNREDGENLITKYTNVDEWSEASGILSEETFSSWDIDTPILNNGLIEINVYNPGDIPTPFYLYIPFKNGVISSGNNEDENFYVRLRNNFMIFNKIERRNSNESGVLINTSNHLIEGVTYISGDFMWKTSGEVYNDCLISGDFVKIIPIGVYELITNNSNLLKEKIQMNCDTSIEDVRLFYDYLYY